MIPNKHLQTRIERLVWEQFESFLSEPEAKGRRSVRRRYGAHRVEPRSFASVIRAYLASEKFRRLAPATQASYLQHLSLAEMPEHLGALPVGVIRPAEVQKFLDKLADRPGAQMVMRSCLKCVEAFALPRDLLPFPITTGTEVVGSDGGHEPWTDEQVALVEKCARPEVARAVTLGANTGQRGSDLIKMRWSDVAEVDGRRGIHVIQKKTGLQLWIPFTAALEYAIDTWERRPGFILLNSKAMPYRTQKHLRMAWFREINANETLAPCRDLVLHGLRATAVVRLRRAGATTPQIVDMVGLSAPMVERYSRFADQKQSALAAVVLLDRKANRTGQEQQNGTAAGKLKA